MSSESEPQRGTTEYQYENERESRLMPMNLKPLDSCIFRILSPPKLRPPYAIDVPVFVAKVVPTKEIGVISLEFEDKSEARRGWSIYMAPFDKDGFIIHNNVGIGRNLDLPEGIVRTGYLLHPIDAYDAELAELVSQSKGSDLLR